jgi:hypothetical protein
LHSVHASWSNAESSFAHAALTIAGGQAGIVGAAFRTIRSSAIEARFFAIDGSVRTTRRDAQAAGANATGALRTERAGFSVGARETTNATIDVTFAWVFGAVRALVFDAFVHLAREIARAALNAVEARQTIAIAITNAARSVGFGAERAFGYGIMREHAIGTNIGRAFFGVVVSIVNGHIDDVERIVALPFDAIAVELRVQGRPRSFQSFTPAFAICAFGFAAEIRNAIVFAIACHGAFRGRTAAAAAIAASAITTRSTSTGITAASR